MRAALILVLALSATADAKPCVPIKPAPKVLTPAGATIAKGGGIIVAYRAAETAEDKAWRVRAGSKLISPGIRPIAPGLELYDVGEASGALVLEDTDQTELLAVRGGKPAALAPPKLKRVWTNSRSSAVRSYAFVVAELHAKPPEQALALIVYGKDGAARSWGAVSPGTTTITVYSTGGCGVQAGGAVPSAMSDTVRLAWVDSAGRISKLSAPITVAMR